MTKYVSISTKQEALAASIDSYFGATLVACEPHAWVECGLTYYVQPSDMLGVFSELKIDEIFSFNMLLDVTVVDWMDRREPRFDLVYQLLSLTKLHRLTMKIAVPEARPNVLSVSGLWQSALFLEREVWDMFGICFDGHPDLRRILLYEEFEGHPLRKDYPKRQKQPRVSLRVPEMRNTSVDMVRDELVAMPTRRKSE